MVIYVKVELGSPSKLGLNVMICLERGNGASWGALTRPPPHRYGRKLFEILMSSVVCRIIDPHLIQLRRT